MTSERGSDPACSDPCCSYRADVEMGQLVPVEEVMRLEAVVRTLRRKQALSLDNVRLPCGVCRQRGVISGFWYMTLKTCPACHGKGYR